ncbi:MAG: ComEC/Rec2 family competence protein [Candidatus Coproplasma sp.]
MAFSHKRKSGLSKGVLSAIIITVISFVALTVLIVVNLFVPIKYLSTYALSYEIREEGTGRITYIDVGTGECILCELPDGKVLLIDGGDGSYANQKRILTTLNSRKIESIDYLICSSVKEEHCGGLAEIVKYKKVTRAYIPYSTNTRITESYYSFICALEESGAEVKIANVGEGVNGENYFFTFLSPSTYLSQSSEYADMNALSNKANIDNASAVVWLECDGISFAFTSDVREDVFKKIVDSYEMCKALGQKYCPQGDKRVELEECDFVTVSGHGNDKNTYAPWYDITLPEIALLGIGENSSQSLSTESLFNIDGVGAELYITMDSGNITVTVKDGKYFLNKEKK